MFCLDARLEKKIIKGLSISFSCGPVSKVLQKVWAFRFSLSPLVVRIWLDGRFAIGMMIRVGQGPPEPSSAFCGRGSFGKDKPFAKFVFSVNAAQRWHLQSKFVELRVNSCLNGGKSPSDRQNEAELKKSKGLPV